MKRIRQAMRFNRANVVFAVKGMPYISFIMASLFVVSAAFVYAAVYFVANKIIEVVGLTSLMSVIVFMSQMLFARRMSDDDSISGFWRKLKPSWIWHYWDIMLVGVATHYSAFTIGVSSFGPVVLKSPSTVTLAVVIIQQMLLNGAAIILINAFGRARTRRARTRRTRTRKS